jgi:glycosyltransferase involved in cell wall biosynthesis
MPLIGPDALSKVFEDILAGKRRLVVWGVLDSTTVNFWQCPLPVDYIIDLNWQLWETDYNGLRVLSPSVLGAEPQGQIVVLVHYEFGKVFDLVTAFLDRFGGPDYFTPICLGEVALPREPISLPRRSLRELIAAPAGPESRVERTHALWEKASSEDHLGRSKRLVADFRNRTRQKPPAARVGKAVLMIEQLHLGGAERQICNLAIGLRREGWEVVLAAHRQAVAEVAHYIQSIREAGVRYVVIPPTLPEGKDLGVILATALGAEIAEILWHLPGFLLSSIIALYSFLEEERPDILACYLDRSNVIGSMAGILAGVPSIIMSGRNVNPTQLPHFYKGQTKHFLRLYQLVIGLPGVTMSANSYYGASSYADWLGVALTDIPVVPNGLLDSSAHYGRGSASACRALMGVPAKGKIVLGIFRLAPEKRPTMFVEVFARLRKSIPDLQGVICGGGMLESSVAERIEALGLAGILRIVPSVRDVGIVIAMADLLLHVAEFEGTPNVILEAQAGGLPVVSTLSGGTGEVLAPELRAFATDLDDMDGLERNALRILIDDKLRSRLRRQGRKHMRRRHSLAALVANTLAAMNSPRSGAA